MNHRAVYHDLASEIRRLRRYVRELEHENARLEEEAACMQEEASRARVRAQRAARGLNGEGGTRRHGDTAHGRDRTARTERLARAFDERADAAVMYAGLVRDHASLEAIGDALARFVAAGDMCAKLLREAYGETGPSPCPSLHGNPLAWE